MSEVLTKPDRPDPSRYFETVGDSRTSVAEGEPVCLYLEVTNRCNLLCETCPRTFEELEPPADMDWGLFTRIVDQVPNISRVVLHGVGEPMLVKTLPRMVSYLKARGAYVLFNTNGTLLNPKNGRALAEAGLDELRVSLDAADAKAFLAVRGKDYFHRIVRNLRAFTAAQREEGWSRPAVSLWLTGLRETIDQLPAFVALAHDIGVRAVHLQRLVFPPGGLGLARPEQALFESLAADEAAPLRAAEAPGPRSRHKFRRLGCHRAWHQPEATSRRQAVVAVPPAVVADVFHRARARDPVLHRSVLDARI